MEGPNNGHTADEFPEIRKLISRIHKSIRRQSLSDAPTDAQQRVQIRLE